MIAHFLVAEFTIFGVTLQYWMIVAVVIVLAFLIWFWRGYPRQPV
jgi:hypothetical protein